MTVFYVVILLILAVSGIALWRNKGDLGKAWEALVAFIAALIAAGVHLWGGQ